MINRILKIVEHLMKYAHKITNKQYAMQLELLHKDGMVLQFLPFHIKDSPNAVRIAIENNPLAFRYASERIRSDFSFSFFAVNKAPQNFQFVPRKIRFGYDFLVKVVEKYPEIYASLPDEYKNTPEIAISMLIGNGAENFVFLPDSLKNDRNFLRKASFIKCKSPITEYNILNNFDVSMRLRRMLNMHHKYFNI